MAQAICEQCGSVYLVPPCRIQKTHFCSSRCGGLFRRAERDKTTLEAVKASKPGMKKCLVCREEKSFSEFNKRKDSIDGLRHECKVCRAIAQANWMADEQNHERKNKAGSAYYEREAERIGREAREKYAADPEPIRLRNKKWRDANPDYGRIRYAKNPERSRAHRRADYRRNKPRYVAAARKREADKLQATPSWADLRAIEQFYVEAARLTKLTGIKHHVDHIYPLRSKVMCGLHVEANLQVVPYIVNLRKSNRIEQAAGTPLCCAWPSVINFQATQDGF